MVGSIILLILVTIVVSTLGALLYLLAYSMTEPDKLILCISCYEEFKTRLDKPSLRLCSSCCDNPRDLPDWCCPKCGWDCTSVDLTPDAPVEYSNEVPDWEYGYLGGAHWTETWTCPECSTVFEVDNGSV